jgi:ADP-ribose pyrophosphatase
VIVRSSRTLYVGRVVTLRVDEIEDRGRVRTAEVVEHHGAVVIVAQPSPDSIVLVEQYRYPLGLRQWEVPAGSIEPGEEASLAAARELREETGYTAGSLRRVWSAYSAPGFCTELLHFYAASGLSPGAREPDEGEEDMVVRTFSLDAAWSLVERDELRDAKTQIALAWALRAR